MMAILEDIARALILVLTGDAEVWHVTAVSLQVSALALAGAVAVGVPIAYGLAWSGERRVRVSTIVLHGLTALPTVVVGLGLYFAFSHAGPLGWTDLLYTRTAMVAGQVVLATPIVAALALTALRKLPPAARETALTLGFGRLQRMRVLLREARAPIVSAVLIAFARIFTELGAAVILGGNIRHRTRTLTTVIALEHSKGEDARAMAMGIILLAVALGITAAIHATAVVETRRTAAGPARR